MKISNFITLQFMVIAACVMGSAMGSPTAAPNHRSKGGGNQMSAFGDSGDKGVEATHYGIVDVCEKVNEVVTVLKGHPLSNGVCRSHLGIKTRYVKRTVKMTRTRTATRTATRTVGSVSGDSNVVEVVITVTPQAPTETIYQTITGDPATEVVTRTAESIITSTVTTVTVREGQEPIETKRPTRKARIRSERGSFNRELQGRGSFNPELQERMNLNNRGSFNPELMERDSDAEVLSRHIKDTDDVTNNVHRHLVQKFGTSKVSQGCKCLNVPTPTKTVLVTQTHIEWTALSRTIMVTSISTSTATALTTTTQAPTTETLTSTITITPTTTITETITTTTIHPATATATLPAQCFDERKLGYGQSHFLRLADITNEGPIPYEECCYRCYNTPNCLFFSYRNGADCQIWRGSALEADYVEVDKQCPNGIYTGGRLESPGYGVEYPGPCTYGQEKCSVCGF